MHGEIIIGDYFPIKIPICAAESLCHLQFMAEVMRNLRGVLI